MTSIAKDECADANRHCPFGASRNVVENFAPKRCKAERYLHFAGHSTDLILCCDVLNGDNGQRSTLWFIDDAFLYVAQSGCKVAMARNCAPFSRPANDAVGLRLTENSLSHSSRYRFPVGSGAIHAGRSESSVQMAVDTAMLTPTFAL